MCVYVLCSQSLTCDSLQPAGSSVHGIPQARILGVGCHALLQGIFLIQGLNSFFYISCIDKQILYLESHLGSLHACALRVNSGQTKKDQKTQLPLLRSLEQKQGAVCAFCTQYHLQDGRSLSPGHPLTCAL